MNTETTSIAPKAPKVGKPQGTREERAAAKKALAPKPKAKPAKKAAPKAPPAPAIDPAVAAINARLDKSKERLAARPKPAAAKKPAKPAKPAKKPSGSTYASLAAAHAGASTVEHPVQVMWNLCDEMQNSRRKDVIAAAVEKGVGYYTARTQYQLWLTAFRNS